MLWEALRGSLLLKGGLWRLFHRDSPSFASLTLCLWPWRSAEKPRVSKQCPADGVWRIWQASISRHSWLDTIYALRDHLNNVQLINGVCRVPSGCVSGHGLLDMVKKHMGMGKVHFPVLSFIFFWGGNALFFLREDFLFLSICRKFTALWESWWNPFAIFLRFTAMCPSMSAFFCRKVHFSIGKALSRRKGHVSAGKPLSLQVKSCFCSLLGGVKKLWVLVCFRLKLLSYFRNSEFHALKI